MVRNGRLEFFHGHGSADIASRTPVTADTVYRIGSITKTFTAIAVMQLWEQELVDLDAPANDYLRAYRVTPANATHAPVTNQQQRRRRSTSISQACPSTSNPPRRTLDRGPPRLAL
ncbi:MAG: serine hydrolase domain-containing protein [Actinomycetes bacterium]